MVLLAIGLLTEVFTTVRPYLGPDNLLPLASIIAAAAGLIMLFWNRAKGLVRKVFGRSRPADAEADGSTGETEIKPPDSPHHL